MRSNVGYIYDVGETIPGTRFRVKKQLGLGGMGSVYEVAAPLRGELYVFKVLHPHLLKGTRIRERLKKEAQLLTEFEHKNIVQVLFTGETADNPPLPFYAMERLHGCTLGDLQQRLQGKWIPAADALAIMQGLMEALGYAHGRGVVHRDVKPDNVFLHIETDGRMTVKLLDFGIVRVLGEARATTAGFVGTLSMASPEQLRNEDPTPACDIYAAGMTFYEMLTNRNPFGELEDEQAVVRAHLTGQPTPVSAWRAVPPELDALVLAMIAKSPEERPNAKVVLEALHRFDSWLGDTQVAVEQLARFNWTDLRSSDAPQPVVPGAYASPQAVEAPRGPFGEIPVAQNLDGTPYRISPSAFGQPPQGTEAGLSTHSGASTATDLSKWRAGTRRVKVGLVVGLAALFCGTTLAIAYALHWGSLADVAVRPASSASHATARARPVVDAGTVASHPLETTTILPQPLASSAPAPSAETTSSSSWNTATASAPAPTRAEAEAPTRTELVRPASSHNSRPARPHVPRPKPETPNKRPAALGEALLEAP